MAFGRDRDLRVGRVACLLGDVGVDQQRSELRDQATRTLYWFGRMNPEALFELTVDSLLVNDPYVCERMLAASYGVAMVLQNGADANIFRNERLPRFAKRIFDLMFSERAPFRLRIHSGGTMPKESSRSHCVGAQIFSRATIKR